MHYHAEVLMPPQNDVMDGLDKVLRSFNDDESAFPEDESYYQYLGLWDYWVVGGRWSGAKMKASLGEEKINLFREELAKREITVSGIQFGKQELSPASQIPLVDSLWQEWFPDSSERCLLFKHAGDVMDYDICPLSDVPDNLKAKNLFIAGNGYNDELDCKHLLCASYWNGCNHQPTKWNGNVLDGVKEYIASMNNYKDEYKDKCTPKDDWVCVTIDYHS